MLGTSNLEAPRHSRRVLTLHAKVSDCVGKAGMTQHLPDQLGVIRLAVDERYFGERCPAVEGMGTIGVAQPMRRSPVLISH
jgi:hypothetical protein